MRGPPLGRDRNEGSVESSQITLTDAHRVLSHSSHVPSSASAKSALPHANILSTSAAMPAGYVHFPPISHPTSMPTSPLPHFCFRSMEL
jgi:hypothetical protein